MILSFSEFSNWSQGEIKHVWKRSIRPENIHLGSSTRKSM